MELVEEMDVGEVQKWLRHHQFSDSTMEKCKGPIFDFEDDTSTIATGSESMDKGSTSDGTTELKVIGSSDGLTEGIDDRRAAEKNDEVKDTLILSSSSAGEIQERKSREEHGFTQKSAQIIVMSAFGAHNIKEISRTQLASAAKYFLPAQEKKELLKSDKAQYLLPLANAFIKNKIIILSKGADKSNLTLDDVKKEGTFN